MKVYFIFFILFILFYLFFILFILFIYLFYFIFFFCLFVMKDYGKMNYSEPNMICSSFFVHADLFEASTSKNIADGHRSVDIDPHYC
jgi:hypothetical protein